VFVGGVYGPAEAGPLQGFQSLISQFFGNREAGRFQGLQSLISEFFQQAVKPGPFKASGR
jgi:hypothetical protein